MPCLVCGTEWEEASASGPFIPCDCGNCVTRDDWRDMAPGKLEAMCATWREFLEWWYRGGTTPTKGDDESC